LSYLKFVFYSIVKLVIICKNAVNDFLDKNGHYLAAAISFYALFSLFPLILALTSLSGFIFKSPEQEAQLAIDITQIIPVSAQFVGDTVKGVVLAKPITGIAGLLGLIWAATSVFSAIRKGVNSAWGIKKPRPFLHERVIDFLLAMGAGVLFLLFVSFSATPGFFKELPILSHFNSSFPGSFWDERISRVIQAVVTFTIFLLLYRFLPNTKVEFRDVWWGALAASLAFELTKAAFVWYLEASSVYNAVYGAIGAVIALLTWGYVSAIIFLFGALVTSRYAEHRASERSKESAFRHLWAEVSRVKATAGESQKHQEL